MHTQTTKTFQHVSDEKLATLSRSRWNWNQIRSIAFWITTFVVVFELTAGSMWNLLQIECVRVQLSHLGYPDYFAYISGAWQVGGAAVIIAPRFPRLKEWAYAGAFFQWSPSRLGRSNRDPPFSVCRFVPNAAPGRSSPARAGS
jgi:DoxX-like family